MFTKYQEQMRNLKEILEMLKHSNQFDSSFLGTVDNAVRCIESAWDSFPDDYKQEIEEEYSHNVVGDMLKAINIYIQDIKEHRNPSKQFQNSCRVVGDRINYYTNEATRKPEPPEYQPENNPPERFMPPTPPEETEEENFEENQPEEEIPPMTEEFPLDSDTDDIDDTEELPPQSQEIQPPPQQKPVPKKEKSAPKNSQHMKPYFFNRSDRTPEEMQERFADAQKCVILVNHRNSDGKIVLSYGLRRGLTIGTPLVTPDKETAVKRLSFLERFKNSFHKKYEGSIFTHYGSVKFNHKNFIKLPSLTGYQVENDDIPTHLVYGENENSGSLVRLIFIPRKDGIKIECRVENAKSEKADFLSRVSSGFDNDKTDSILIYEGNGENQNIIDYSCKTVELTYELEQKRENSDSPDVKTEIVVHLEF